MTTLNPNQIEGAPSKDSRRGRGANNQRLHVSDAGSVPFAVPVAVRAPKVHETEKPTRGGESVPEATHCGQLPGCLPKGRTIDDLLTFPKEAAIWLQQSESWCVKHEHCLPGVIIESQKVKRFHPRTYLERSLPPKRK